MLKPSLERRLELGFAAEELDAARSVVLACAAALASVARVDVDRVLKAVVVLAEGDLERLRHFAVQAQTDYRDVLYWSETPPEPGSG